MLETHIAALIKLIWKNEYISQHNMAFAFLEYEVHVEIDKVHPTVDIIIIKNGEPDVAYSEYVVEATKRKMRRSHYVILPSIVMGEMK